MREHVTATFRFSINNLLLSLLLIISLRSSPALVLSQLFWLLASCLFLRLSFLCANGDKSSCAMLHGKPLQSRLRPLCVLVYPLLLAHICTGQPQLIGPSQPIVATLGDDVILPCRLAPAEDASGLTLEWTRPDLDPRFVYVRRSGQELVVKKHPSFEGRTSLSIGELKFGNMSLKLSNVNRADQGTYRCFIPALDRQSFVQLVVASGAVSSPVVTLAGIDEATSGVVLQCESEGWYPEPEVSWLDGEGKLLSAGPPEAVRGPDGLYTVSSRVAVEKRHGSSFTCRVQQKDINQTRETHVHVPDDFFMVQSSSSPATVVLAVSLAACLVFISAVVFSVSKWRRNIIRTKRSHHDESPEEEWKNRSETTSWNPYKWFKDEHQGKEEVERKVESLTADVQELTDEKQKSEDNKKELQTQLETRTKELKDNQEAHMKTNEDLKETHLQLENKISEISKFMEQLQVQQQRAEKAETDLKEQQKENKKLEEQFQQEKTQRKEEVMELKTKVEGLTANVKKLTVEKQKNENNKNKLQQDLEKKSKELKDNQEAHMKTNEDLKGTHLQLEKKKSEISKLEKQLQDLQQRAEKAEKDLQEQLDMKKKLEKQLQDQQQRAEKAETDLKEQQKENKKLQEETTKMRETEKNVKNQKEELETKRDDASSASHRT